MIEMTEFQREVYEQNYKAQKDDNIQDTWRREAKGASIVEIDELNIELTEALFYDALEDWKFSPGGRIVSNIGVDGRQETTLFNCFVHHPIDIGYKDPDSITGIYDMLKAQANTLKSEGGYGTNFSYIRPNGMYVSGIGARTPGVLKFMELWNQSSEDITMGSNKILGPERGDEKKKIRKGAQMGVLDIWHPEIEDFIKVKQTPGRLTKFNLSVGITDGFMNAVINNEDWDLKFPDTTYSEYTTQWAGDIKSWEDKGFPVTVYKTIKAKKLWDLIMESTYQRNEPGVLFLDLANKLNAINYAEIIKASNPCGEILMGTGVCNLGSIVLVKFIKQEEDGTFSFNFTKFKKYIRTAVRFLDNINDISRLPLPEYKRSILEKRRIGLGVMGMGSLHFMLGIRYGSNESIKLVNKIFKIKAETELLASAELGKEKGSFPLFDKEKYFNTYWWKNLEIDNEIKQKIEEIGYMRNSHHSANAPNGNSSIFCGGVSGGIEPVYMKEYTRWVTIPPKDVTELKKQGLVVPDISKKEWFETEYFKFDDRGGEQILSGVFGDTKYEIDKNRGLTKAVNVEDYGWKWVKENYNQQKIKEMEDAGVFDTTTQLTVDDHINVLKAVAKFINMNSSKTVNIPENYSYNDFKKLYMDAWKGNIKGITSYRSGTMTAVLEEKKEIKQYQSELEKMFIKSNGNVLKESVSLPTEYYAKGYKFKDKNKHNWYINVAFADTKYRKPFAIFIKTNRRESTGVADDVINAVEGLIRKKKIREELIEEQRKDYSGQSNVDKIARAIGMCLRHNIPIIDIINTLDECHDGFSTILHFITKLLSTFIPDGTKSMLPDGKGEKCPICNRSTIVYQEGCKMCKNCSWSRCG